MAGQKFTLTFDANLNVSQMNGALKQIQSTLNGLQLPQNITRGLQSDIDKLQKEITRFETSASKDITGKTDISKLENQAQRISEAFNQLKRSFSNLAGLKGKDLEKLFPDSIKTNITNSSKALSDYTKELAKATTAVKDQKANVDSLKQKISDLQSKKTYTNTEWQQLQKDIKAVDAELTNYKKLKEDAEKTRLDKETALPNTYKNSPYWRQAVKDIQKYQQEIDNAQKKLDALRQTRNVGIKQEDQVKNLQKLNDELTTEQQKLQQLVQITQQLSSKNQGGGLEQLIKQVEQLTGLDMSQFKQTTEGVGEAIQTYLNQRLQQLGTILANASNNINNANHAFDDNRRQVLDCAQAYEQFNTQVRDVDQLKSRILYFFSLNNTIQLVKRTMRDAYETVKDLDKAMTETAVVTDFSVGDMWSQLPEYTKRANELGVTTQAAYEAATLYYQQGLNTNEVMAMSNETLKMARIAGLDAAEATDRMTNAIRGFNMEINTANAQRIDDVYSRLAAISASNVDEISTAMTKVASLASNANMEFETTAAFLAQIIETTRESAETAGTALKTVVARFSEVKKLVDEGALKGQDEEGQMIDVNKVSAALRTTGIDLNKYFLGEVGLDDIFMELASKWDSLTTLQQRYIATQAAGSRQQSRFIALMSDYARTQELVGEAYKANGASAKQFEKTQESLQSKLAKLKNAWNEFAMGILNSDIIKFGVDLLTGLLNGVNALTSGFGALNSNVGSFINTFAKLALLLGGLNIAKGLTFGLFGSLAGLNFKDAAANAMLGNNASTMAGKGLLPTLGAGFINPFMGIGKAGKAIWGGAKNLGAFLGVGTNKAALAASGGMSWLAGGTGASGAAAGLAGLGVGLAAIAGVVGAAYGAYQLWLNFSPEGKLKKAQKAAEDASKALQEAEDKQKSISSFQETYDEQTEKVNAATTTEERSEAIQSRNEAILNAIKENPDYSEYVDTTFTTTGELVLTLNEEKVTAAAIEAAKEATRASISSYIAQAEVYSREATIQQNRVAATEAYQQAQTNLDSSNATAYAGAQAGIALGQLLFGNQTEADQLNSIAEVQKKTELARKQIELAYASMIDLFDTDLASELEGNLAKTLSQIYQETGTVLSEDVFESLLNGLASGDINSDIFTNNIDFSLGQINLDTQQGFANFLNQIGVTVADLDDFSEAIGDETGAIKAVLKARAKEIQIIQAQARGRVFQKLFEAGMTLDTATQNQINRLAPDQVDQIYTALENAQNILSPENFASFAPSLLSSVGTELFNEIGELFSSINLDDPIGAFNSLATAEKTASDSLKTYITQIRESNQELFTATSLVQSFILSADYEELTDSLSDFIKENGQISSKNIEDLAKSNQKLKQLLDTEQISAKALARALTLVEQGKLSFDNITESIINALEAGESFEEVISNVNQWIEDFNEGTDLAEGTDHIVSELETLKEYVSNWEFGNEPTQKIYDHIFGDGAYAAYMHENWGKKSFDQLESDLLGQIEHISGLAENEGLGALQTLSGNLTGLQAEADGLTFHWDLSSFSSTGEAIDEVATKLGVSREAAEAFIESWGSHMWDLREDWNKLNYKEQLTTFTNSLGNAKVITRQELTALGAIVGKSADEVLKDLEELAKANNIDIPVVVNWQDENGGPLTEESLFDKFKETFGEDAFSELSKQFGGKHINAEGLFTELTSRGLSQGQAEQIANKVVSQVNGAMLQKTIQIPEYSIGKNGDITVAQKDVVIEADTWAGLTQAENAALEAAKYDLIGQNIANQDVSSLGDNISSAIISGAEAGSAAMVETIRQALAKENFVINVSPKVSGGGAARASGGLVKSFSKGSASNSLQPGPALTGEEGREIVWNKQRGYAYITGENGPQFQNLQPGDRVFNAAETSRIFRNSSLAKGGLIDSFASGGWKKGDSGSSGGGSGEDKAKEDKWKNEIDWLYNLVEDIAELERIQTKLQEEYDDYLKDQTKNGKDLYNLLIKQLGNLYTQLDHQTYALEQREREMREFMDTTNQYDQYLSYNWADRTLEIDWDGIEALQDKDTYNEIKDLISEAESIQDKMDDAEDAVQDIRNQIEDLENIWRETYTDFEERVLDALVQSYQTVIDNYSELNDTLSDSNSQILNALQKQISLERQIRDNTKTEEDIADQEARLAFLRRDTTGGNELSALQLSSQLDESRQSYEDNLIDQAISKLQEDNDEAAQQRQKQIEIMQAQLDYQQQSGEFNAAVRELLESAMGGDGQLLTDSELMKLLKEQENWAAMSDVSKSVWEEELNGTFKEVAAFILKQNAQENGTYITALTAAIGSISSTIGSYSQALTKISSGSSGGSSGGGGGTTGKKSLNNTEDKDPYGLQMYGNGAYTVTRDGKPLTTVHQGGTYSQVLYDLKKLRGQATNGYATGGLNIKTGPAWLDGTPSEPEYVLNARQTDAFLKLADVLPAFMANNSTSTTTFGGINLNLVMNVDQIASDYDVDRIADRVKSIIYDAGSYRNVNTLNFSR